MTLRVFTANIALGLPDMNRALVNVFRHVAIHGWRIMPLFFAGNTTNKLFDYSTLRFPERLKYVKRHSDLEPVYQVIQNQKPDIVVLNEVLLSAQRDAIEGRLRSWGYQHFAWGKAAQHTSQLAANTDDVTIGTVVAAKHDAHAITIDIPQKAQPGGGGGIAGLQLTHAPYTIIGLHLSNFHRGLWRHQIARLAEQVAALHAAGQHVLLAGDFNATPRQIAHIAEFSKLDLRSADPSEHYTCPTGQLFHFPPKHAIDHIYLPQQMQASDLQFGDFGSDHLFVVATISTQH